MSVDRSIHWPVSCPTCGQGDVYPEARSGRTAHYKNLKSLPVPDDLLIPTCDVCHTELIDRQTAKALDKALEELYGARLTELIVKDLERLAALGISQQRLEKMLGLSQGYLSKVRSGHSRPSMTLVSCLRLLANDPEHRLQEVEDWVEAA